MDKRHLHDNIIKNLPLGFSMVDRNGTIIEFNREAEKITGYRKKEVIGKSHLDILHDPPEADACPLFRLALKKGKRASSAETVMKSRDGRRITADVTVLPIYNENGDFTGGVELFRDVTVQKRKEREQQNFLSMFVHDMKNPVFTSKGFLSRILSSRAGPLTEQQKEYSEIIMGGLEKLEMLINDFLEFAKYESKKYSPELCPVNLRNILEENIQMLKVEAENKDIDIQFTAEPGIPEVPGDESMLNRVVANLLNNAFKHTDAGLCIRVDCTEKERSVVVEIKNPGAKIPEDQLPYIFEAFHRVKEDTEGSGLGLAISEKIIELHKGRIWAAVSPEKETVFGFTLPKG